jgi:hypothetical protein
MNRVVKILMERDGLTQREATRQLKEVREMLYDCGFDPVESEDIVLSELGLEMDYIFDII